MVIDSQELPERTAGESSTVHDELRSSARADLFLQEAEVAGLCQFHGEGVTHRGSG